MSRYDTILGGVLRVHSGGVKPTSRNVLAVLSGKPESHFPHGMGGRDVEYFRQAMRTLGYVQTPKTHRWYMPKSNENDCDVVGLDEVQCNCGNTRFKHVMSQHTGPGLHDLKFTALDNGVLIP